MFKCLAQRGDSVITWATQGTGLAGFLPTPQETYYNRPVDNKMSFQLVAEGLDTVGEISIEHINILSSKCISN